MCSNHAYFHSVMEQGIILGIRHLTEINSSCLKMLLILLKVFNVYTVQGNL
jgi:hypothetical protein